MEQGNYNVVEPQEIEANDFARSLFISPKLWEEQAEALLASQRDEDVISLAEEIEIAPAIVAGRLRWESGDYTRHTQLIGLGNVRKLFPDSENA